MRKLFKRTLVCLIAVMMIVSSLPITALARGGYNWFDVTQGVTMTGSSSGKYGVLFRPHNKNSDYDNYGYALATFQPKDSSGSDITISSDGTFNVQRGTNFSMYVNFGKYLYDSKCGGSSNTSTFISNMDKSSPSWHYGDSSSSSRNFSTYIDSSDYLGYWKAYVSDTYSESGGDSNAVQSGVSGTFANQKSSNNYASTTNLDATLSFSTSSFSGLNTCGVYTLRIKPAFSFRNGTSIQVCTETSANSSQVFTEVVFKVRVVDTYTFKDRNGSTLKTVQATSASEAYNSRPDNSAQTVSYNNNGTHTRTTYSWPTSPSSYVFTETSSSTIETCTTGTETSTVTKEATCENTGLITYTKTCTICNGVQTRTETTSALTHDYVYTYKDASVHTKTCSRGDLTATEEAHTIGSDGKCTYCKTLILDFTAYNTAYTEADDIIKNKSNYTEASFTEYNKIVTEAVKKKDTVTTQEELDNLTATIISAQSVLRKSTCTITVNFISDNSSTADETTSQDVAYGTAQELNLPDEEYVSVKAIIVKTDDGKTQTKLNVGSSKYTLYVTKDVTVEVYLTEKSSTTKEYSKVTFLGKNGNTVNVMYVEKDTTLNTDDITAPEIPFYSFSGWDKASVTGTGSDIYVRAQYTYSTEATKCNVHFVENGEIKWTKEYSYDSYVYLDDADKTKQYALASDKAGTKILTYLDGIEFYAPKTADIYVVEVESKEAKIAITGNFKEELTENSVEKVAASFNCKFYLPADCTPIEWGAEISSGTAKKVVKGEKISQGNEYTIRMKVKKTLVTGGSVTSFTGKAYLIYKDSAGTTHTIYSDEVTQSLT